MVKLYYIRYSCATAVHIALEEIGIPFQTVRVSSDHSEIPDAAGDQGLASLREVNPLLKVPTLVVDGEIMTETLAMLLYAARLVPKAELLPADPFKEAQCLSHMAWFASTVHIAFRKANRPYRFTNNQEAFPEIQAYGREEAWSSLQVIDRMLEGKTWMMGESFSVVDCHAFVFWRWALLAKYPAETLVSLSRFSEQMVARRSVQAVLAREEAGLST